jgi:hypothetical protein
MKKNQSIFYALALMLMPTALMASCPKSGCYAKNSSIYDLEITYTDKAGTTHSKVSFNRRSSIHSIQPGTKVTVFYPGNIGTPNNMNPLHSTSLTFDAGCDTISAGQMPFYQKEVLNHVNWCK